jgi:multiple sugar transport system ATP-binding protein
VSIVLDRVTKVYKGGVLAVDDLVLEVRKGELLVLLGPSGCGKTTILRMIAGLEDMTSGNLWLDGELANGVPPQHRRIAMVFQNGALYPHKTARDNLAFPLKVAGIMDRPEVDARVQELARGLGIGPLLGRKPGALSGGERQRVAIGRALARGEPAVLLMDEPLASLDSSIRSELRMEIEGLVRSLGLTTVYVTHDQAEAMALADRIAVLRGGVLQDVGAPDRVYSDPATAFVAAFLGSPPMNLLMASVWVMIGERIVIDFGSQQLYLPWADPRAGALTLYQGQTVLVGIRPDMLAATAKPADGSALDGKIHSLEYHGHEWLARLEIGARIADIDTTTRRPNHALGMMPAPQNWQAAPVTASRTRNWARSALDLPFHHGRESGKPHPGSDGHGSHRRADLVLRLDSPRGWAVGQAVSVKVDVPRLCIFNAAGQRIDQVPY